MLFKEIKEIIENSGTGLQGIHMSCTDGEITDFRIREARPGRWTDHQVKLVDGVWCNWDKVIVMAETNLCTWSIGNLGMDGYILNKEQAFQFFYKAYSKYNMQLEKESRELVGYWNKFSNMSLEG
jgi:hypothetical protein